MAGPKEYEVTKRETFDTKSGELLNTTHDFAACKLKCEDLPSPRPRSLRTVFHFNRTPANAPASSPPAADQAKCNQACRHGAYMPSASAFTLRLSEHI